MREVTAIKKKKVCTHSVEVPVKGNTTFVLQSGTGNLEISPECAIYSIFLERRKHLTKILTAPKLKTKKKSPLFVRVNAE